MICHYVLNVIETEVEREAILKDLLNYCKPGGQIFVAVRNDTSQLRGWTKKDTFQTLVTLPKPWVLIREASGGHKIYGYKNR